LGFFVFLAGGTMLQDGTYSISIKHIIAAIVIITLCAVGLVQLVGR
jgi:hypothetical protein